MTNGILDPHALEQLLSVAYDLGGPIRCKLIGDGFNHTYLVEGAERWVLRSYLNGKYYVRSADDFRFELDLLTFSAAQGVPVARPLPDTEGNLLTTLSTPQETRHLALFEFAEGAGLPRELPEARAKALGKAVAFLHKTADGFESSHHRYHLNLYYLLDEPLRLLETHLLEHGLGTLDFFERRADELREGVRQVPTTGGAYGVIHADLNPTNVHYDPETGFKLFDFDHCAYGWRAYDLAEPFGSLDRAAWRAFLAGYETLRPLSEPEKVALPTFAALRSIWDMGDVLAMMPVWGKTPDAVLLKEYRGRLEALA